MSLGMNTSDTVSEGLCIGVDVGGTNTDAVILHKKSIVTWHKAATSADIATGVTQAVSRALERIPEKFKCSVIKRICIGTTHFVNAFVQRRGVVPVAVIRLCGPASRALPPFVDFPDDLVSLINGGVYLVDGGYQFDGQVIKEVQESEIIDVINKIRKTEVQNIVISGIFSPVKPDQEQHVASIIKRHCSGLSVTCSYKVGHMGLLERENASILNESLKPMCSRALDALEQAMRVMGLTCPFYLTQNDGTLIGSEDALLFPVHTFSSGPTNSMRGAAFLSGLKDAIVLDIGGTTTDVGVLINGFPRQSSTRIKVGGVTTNFRMPDVFSIGLGGGSHVISLDNGDIAIGPQSVGHWLERDSKIFGGDILTAVDLAVACGYVTDFGQPQLVSSVPLDQAQEGMRRMVTMVEDAIDKIKTSSADQPVIIVGGGCVVIDTTKKAIKGASSVIKPTFFEVANAVGAALCQISGSVDIIVSLDSLSRDTALTQAKNQAISNAILAGGDKSTIEIVESTETGLSYIPGNTTRLQVKAVGDIREGCASDSCPVPSMVSHVSYLAKSDTGYGDTSSDGSVQLAKELSPATTMASSEMHKKPHVEETSGEWILNDHDVECICIGAGILGCGGGGSPYLARLRAMKALKEGKKIRVIHHRRLGSCSSLEGYVAIFGFMGAPTVLIEKLFSGKEGVDAVKIVEQFSKKKIVALMSAEIGGLNGVEPLAVGAELGLPVVDCDGMGRAFPELHMVVPLIYGADWCPASMVDDMGTQVIVGHCKSAKHLENLYRSCIMHSGCTGAVCLCPLSPEDVRDKTVHFSLSHAWNIGSSILRARRSCKPFCDVVTQELGASVLLQGKVMDVDRKTTGGFVRGQVTIHGIDDYSKCIKVDFQNENLIVRSCEGSVLATTPDIISLIDNDTGTPITTEEIKYGLRVIVFVMRSPPQLVEDIALNVVGPQAFGYDFKYEPNGNYIDISSICTP